MTKSDDAMRVALGWASVGTIRELLDTGIEQHPHRDGIVARRREVQRRPVIDAAAMHVGAVLADPNARTRIDDFETPLEIAERSAPHALGAFEKA